MAKISDYTAGEALDDNDLIDVSVNNGDGTYSTRSFEISQIKAIAENLANANLEQTVVTRQYDIVATQLLEFINGDLKMTQSATNYVYWEDGVLYVRGGALGTDVILKCSNDGNGDVFVVDFTNTTVHNVLNLQSVAEEDPSYALGVNSSGDVVKYATGRPIYKVKPEQSATADPVFTTIIDDTGETITVSRTDVGTYLVSGFNGLLTGNVEIKYEGNQIDAGCSVKIFSATGDNNFVIETYDNTNTLADGILKEDTVGLTYFGTITVTKY